MFVFHSQHHLGMYTHASMGPPLLPISLICLFMYTVFCLHLCLWARRGHQNSLEMALNHHVVALDLWKSKHPVFLTHKLLSKAPPLICPSVFSMISGQVLLNILLPSKRVFFSSKFKLLWIVNIPDLTALGLNHKLVTIVN